ncbi:MAG: single-stranded DNA-binding protein [Clostridia bacterium]|nr:single-stranded DNA-binding protein [Clostridia bacterium]
MENAANQITLTGTLHALPELSHSNHGRNFYRFYLEVERLSGAVDLLPVLAAEDVLMQADLFLGSRFQVIGQIRSFNSHAPGSRRLVICVYAQSVQTTGLEAQNDAFLSGTVCKPPVYRRTPLGREICDIMLAVPRRYQRTDYIPCILWGRLAQGVSLYPVGTALSLTGRLQSREYIKVLDSGSEKRTAYELSVSTADLSGEPDCPELL